MKEIVIKFIEQKDQRFSSQHGDWWFDEFGDLQIRCTDLGDWRMNSLLAEHELDEALGCKNVGITTKQVDDYCKKVDAGLEVDPDSFSGYPKSPHQIQHNDALAIEWIRSRMLGVNWTKYSEAFESGQTTVECKDDHAG